MSKIDNSVQFFRDTLLGFNLRALIRRDRMDSNRQRRRGLDNSILYSLSGLALDLSQECQTRLSLGKGNDGMAMEDSSYMFIQENVLADISMVTRLAVR